MNEEELYMILLSIEKAKMEMPQEVDTPEAREALFYNGNHRCPMCNYRLTINPGAACMGCPQDVWCMQYLNEDKDGRLSMLRNLRRKLLRCGHEKA